MDNLIATIILILIVAVACTAIFRFVISFEMITLKMATLMIKKTLVSANKTISNLNFTKILNN